MAFRQFGTAAAVAVTLAFAASPTQAATEIQWWHAMREKQAVAANPGELPPGEVIVRIPGATGPAIGERIRAVAPRDKLHLFAADGRKRIG